MVSQSKPKFTIDVGCSTRDEGSPLDNLMDCKDQNCNKVSKLGLHRELSAQDRGQLWIFVGACDVESVVYILADSGLLVLILVQTSF